MHFTSPSRRSVASVAAVATLGLAAACSSEKPRAENPASYDSQLTAELEAERREFVNDRQEQIAELENEINRLQARIEHEGQYAPESEVAQWKQDLFELRQEKDRAQARLERAETMSLAEYKAARGDLALTVDRLQAGVSSLGTRIGRVFTGGGGEEEEQAPETQEPEQEREPVRGEDE